MGQSKWPWLRKAPEVFGLGIMVGGSHQPVAEQIGDLLGCCTTSVESGRKGMA
jgi:hypothetical protein